MPGVGSQQCRCHILGSLILFACHDLGCAGVSIECCVRRGVVVVVVLGA
jgi:hypothetical protein